MNEARPFKELTWGGSDFKSEDPDWEMMGFCPAGKAELAQPPESNHYPAVRTQDLESLWARHWSGHDGVPCKKLRSARSARCCPAAALSLSALRSRTACATIDTFKQEGRGRTFRASARCCCSCLLEKAD